MSVKIFVNNSARNIEELICGENWEYKQLCINVYEVFVEGSPMLIAKIYDTKKSAQHESQILYSLEKLEGFPRVVATILSDEFNCVVMHRVSGIELYELITQKGSFSEKEAKNIIKLLLPIVQSLHNVGITHHDIKPENIIYDQEENKLTLIDFEYNKRTLWYTAPEYFSCDMESKASDMWSIGVVLYTMLTSSIPFDTKAGIRYMEPIIDPDWSPLLIDFVNGLLKKSFKRRLTMKDAMTHPWLKDNN